MLALKTQTLLIYLAISAAAGAIGSQAIVYIVGHDSGCATGGVTGLKSEPLKRTPVKGY